MKNIFVAFAFLFTATATSAQTIVKLYDKVPGAIAAATYIEKADTAANGRVKYAKVTDPTVTVFLPEKSIANGTAVVICPGGSYSGLAFSHEGLDVAKELNKKGIAAFVLKYRLPSDVIMENKEIGPLQDAQSAIKMVRENAAKYNVNPAKVGIMGFSAGGHLVSTASVAYDRKVIYNPKGTSLRPDFVALIYPVISFMPGLEHKGSRTNLIGATPTEEKLKFYSNDQQVTSQTPPSFLVHAGDDKTVPVANSLRYYEALQKAGVKAELHIYPAGGHGFGMVNATTNDKWVERFYNWLSTGGFM